MDPATEAGGGVEDVYCSVGAEEYDEDPYDESSRREEGEKTHTTDHETRGGESSAQSGFKFKSLSFLGRRELGAWTGKGDDQKL